MNVPIAGASEHRCFKMRSNQLRYSQLAGPIITVSDDSKSLARLAQR